MKKSIRILGLALVGFAALVLPLNAHAACGYGLGGSFGSYYSIVTGTTVGPSLRSSFWMVGAGNPLIGAGSDNGSVSEAGHWLFYKGSFLSLFDAWGNNTDYDGCSDLQGATGRMAWAMSDINGAGQMVYAAGCAQRDGRVFWVEFNFTQPPGCYDGNCGTPLALVPAPKAVISGTTRAGTQAFVTVAPPNFAPGYYSDGTPGCALANVIPSYDVYKQELSRNAPAPANLDVTAGWVLAGTGNIGSPFTFTTTCVTDCDVYISLAPRYDSGFTTDEPATGAPARVGPSTKIHAGPVLANPPRPRTLTHTKQAE
jgi:hypothetical protein